MKEIPFTKVVGCGNDFILVDARGKDFSGSPRSFAKNWCERKRGIGADGLLLVSGSRKADARMRIFNSDGSEAQMCGNGLRCVAWYLHSRDHGKKTWTVETGAGVMRAQLLSSGRIRLFLMPPKGLRLGLTLRTSGKTVRLHAVNTGVPHAVIFTENIKKADVKTLGKAVRFHRLFRPSGTNVDFVQILSPSKIRLRTYERGVEAETLACGTGAVAGAAIGLALGKLKSPIDVLPPSGEKLTVHFEDGPSQPWQKVSLEGQAKILYEGRVGA